jgi:hypothetical protein
MKFTGINESGMMSQQNPHPTSQHGNQVEVQVSEKSTHKNLTKCVERKQFTTDDEKNTLLKPVLKKVLPTILPRV